jgi:hypothetical protein
VRQSPLIGPRIPVHGLVVDIETGKLEWVVNGYEMLERATTAQPTLAAMPEFKLGEMKFPDMKIGDVRAPEQTHVITPHAPQPAAVPTPHPQPVHTRHPAEPDELPERSGVREALRRIPVPKLDPQALFKIVGADKKIYGPVSPFHADPKNRQQKMAASGRTPHQRSPAGNSHAAATAACVWKERQGYVMRGA